MFITLHIKYHNPQCQCWRFLGSSLSPDFLCRTHESFLLKKKSQNLEASVFLPYTIQVLNLRAEFPAYDPVLKWEPNVCLRFSSLRVCCLFWLGWNVSGQCQPALQRWRGAFSLALTGLLATSSGYLYAGLTGEGLWYCCLIYSWGKSNLPEKHTEIRCGEFVVSVVRCALKWFQTYFLSAGVNHGPRHMHQTKRYHIWHIL